MRNDNKCLIALNLFGTSNDFIQNRENNKLKYWMTSIKKLQQLKISRTLERNLKQAIIWCKDKNILGSFEK